MTKCFHSDALLFRHWTSHPLLAECNSANIYDFFYSLNFISAYKNGGKKLLACWLLSFRWVFDIFFFKSRIPSPKVSISRTKEEEADRKFVANQVHTRARLSAYAPTEHTKNIGKEEGNYWWQILIGFHWQRRKKGRAGDNFVNIFSLLCRGIGDVVEKCNEKGGSDRWPCSSSVWRKSVMTPSDDICVAPMYRLIKQVEALRRRISAWCHSWLLYSNDVCIRILDRNKGDAIREQVT